MFYQYENSFYKEQIEQLEMSCSKDKEIKSKSPIKKPTYASVMIETCLKASGNPMTIMEISAVTGLKKARIGKIISAMLSHGKRNIKIAKGSRYGRRMVTYREID